MATAPPTFGGGGASSVPGSRSSGWTGLGVAPDAGGGAPDRAGGEPAGRDRIPPRDRTEFIIVMYWVEPLPTEPDELKGGPATPPAPQ